MNGGFILNGENAKKFDVIVIGGGHAGCEAALAAARLGASTIMFAINLDSIAMMPCNPNIGGTSKGHLVREIDALGGEMGKNIDRAFIQSRMLNTGKGPAVHSLRAQADKAKYTAQMKSVLENTENLKIRQAEVSQILAENGEITGVVTSFGETYHARAVIICTGTYQNSRCLYGEIVNETGPNGLKNSRYLTASLKQLGVRILRFKTGTPARVDKRSVDFSKMSEQAGDSELVPFSFTNTSKDIYREQIPCHLTYTSSQTHEIILENLHRSPMYSGIIEGTGTRYCPSIEDKIVRFPDKDRHQVFIEPEGEFTNEMYIQGMSTSLPPDVQEKMYRSVPGLENCEIMRMGYAIEYDCIDATQLLPTLEFKQIRGLYSAGQFNGSSGYEEAAAQGLVAGINAALAVFGREPFTLSRSDAYIGVLIDDLVLKGSAEPYRMMTSRAEYRLLLRQDNADLRLTEKGHEVGLIPNDRYERFLEKKRLIESEIKRLESIIFPPTEGLNEILAEKDSTPVQTGVRFTELLKRPELRLADFSELVEFDAPGDVLEQVEITIKYEGYIKRQIEQVERFKKLDGKKLPKDIDYTAIKNLSAEARQKLSKIMPESVGQAQRITGVSPADVSVLLIYLQQFSSQHHTV